MESKEKDLYDVSDLGLDFDEEQAAEAELPGLSEEDPSLADLTDEEKEVFKKVMQKQSQQDPILLGFKNLEAKPTEAQIEEWKRIHGKVFAIGFNDDEYYVFRPLRRLEWRNLMKALVKQDDESKRKEAICQRSVLWPSLTPDNLAKSMAGTVDSLYEMVCQASNFLAPQEALACVRKL